MLKLLGALLISGVSLFAMHSAQININDKDLEVGAKLDMGQFNQSVEPDSTFLGFSYINASDEHSVDEADVDGYGEVNFLIMQPVGKSGFKVGIGVKANYTSLEIEKEDQIFMSIPLGVEMQYRLPIADAFPISLGAKLYYAPESLSFGEAQSFLEYRAFVLLEVIPRGSIVGGFRSLDTNYEIETKEYKVNYNKSAYFGFSFSF